jgi:cytochrome c oxidase assembly protein subunit 15
MTMREARQRADCRAFGRSIWSTVQSASERRGSLPTAEIRQRAIRLWLLSIAALVFVMVLVGGATRLTESGLSIVEWQPVTGTLPPLSPAEWESEFAKYQATPQYQHVNRGMRLDEFKTIYWWEWAHRLLGRLIGVMFFVPFVWFLWRGWVAPGLRPRLWTIFALGTLQGAVGWWMVASGLVNRIEVSQYRLATHLVLACLIFVATLWTERGLAGRAGIAVPTRLRSSAIGLVVLVLVQIYLGALLAGIRGGLLYNTWPLIDGAFVPPFGQLFAADHGWWNLFENPLTVQFDHRMVAYALWIVALLHVIDVIRARMAPALNGALALAVAVTIQAGFGIVTLVHQAPLGLALAHQGMAMVVLTLAVIHAQRLSAVTQEAFGLAPARQRGVEQGRGSHA